MLTILLVVYSIGFGAMLFLLFIVGVLFRSAYTWKDRFYDLLTCIFWPYVLLTTIFDMTRKKR